jgi:hypothetical protein
MHNDSIETLLLRHYGHAASTPAGMEQRLLAANRQAVAEQQRQQLITARIRQRRLSRRQIIRFVALGSAGLGILSASMESLHMIESTLLGHDVQKQSVQPAVS